MHFCGPRRVRHLPATVIRWDVRVPVLGELKSLVERHDAELRHLVSQAVRSGARTQDIAEAVGVSRSTLWRRYRAELLRTDGGGD